MASRRDELNAYTFARKRTVGAFLQPSGGGNDEDAPRPVKAVLPSVVVAAVIVAGFGMWGAFKPAAPVGWDDGKTIIQGKDSTTRYVVLNDNGVKTLHQVLNMASARLLMPAGAKVLPVADAVLDAYPNHGATVGIQYAPDRLPLSDDAGQAKKWSVCDKVVTTADGGANINQALFVAAGKEATKLGNSSMLGPGQQLFVQERDEEASGGFKDGSMFLVDRNGLKHAIGDFGTSSDTRNALIAAAFKAQAKPQPVSKAWLDTLVDGSKVVFPDSLIPGFSPGSVTPSSVKLSNPADKTVGRLLQYQDQYFVVGDTELWPITGFQAKLLLGDPFLDKVYKDNGGTAKADQLSPSDFASLVHHSMDDSKMVSKDSNLPREAPTATVNLPDFGGHNVVCSTFEGMDGNTVKRSVWADTNYPATISAASASAHVTPGHGLFYKAFDAEGGPDGSGTNYLITETGLRYPVQVNTTDKSKTGASAPPAQQPGDQSGAEAAQARLGYKDIQPTLVPDLWSKLVPGGPVLNSDDAAQAQNS